MKVTKTKIGKSDAPEKAEQEENTIAKKSRLPTKKVVYIEIDDEITSIYEKIRHLKMKNIYLVVPKRAVLFQSIVNLKILKRKAEDLNKNIYIITNDHNGIHLAGKIGLTVYDKLETPEHPSLVSGKVIEENDITPLKASVNTLDEEAPLRRDEKKLSISELVSKGKKKLLPTFGGKQAKAAKAESGPIGSESGHQKERQGRDKGHFVLVAPNKQALVLLVAISVIVLLVITYIALPGATITLTPRSNVIDTSVNVILADIEANRAELDIRPLHEIPSYTITKKIQKALTYQATGKNFQGQNASGILTVTNLSDDDWPLVAKTRFQTNDGIVFRLQNAVTVPAKRGDKPGTLDVPVVADEKDMYEKIVGDRGNIQPTRFFLPGLSADNQKKLFAESKVPFTGGKTLVTVFISKEDIEAAKQRLADDLKAGAIAELQAAVREKNAAQNSNLALLTGRDAIQTGEPKITVPPNLENVQQTSFDLQGELVTTGITYSKDDLLNILTAELKLKKSPQKRLVYIDDQSLVYKIIDTDKTAKKIKITATIQGREEFEISPDKENGERLIKKIKDHIIGKEIKEAQAYIQNLPEIEKVKIEPWPAWAPTLPGIPDNIRIEIKREITKVLADTQAQAN